MTFDLKYEEFYLCITIHTPYTLENCSDSSLEMISLRGENGKMRKN